MKLLAVIVLALVALVSSRSIEIEDIIDVEQTTAYDYHNRVGILRAEAIRAYEASPQSRITGGQHALHAQFPYQAGLLIALRNGATSVCGGSIINAWRVLTAAHCWLDGFTPANHLTIVAGTVWLFSGGQRITTSDVATHPHWTPHLIQNDIAVSRLPWALSLSYAVTYIPLPSGHQEHMNFNGFPTTATGFGGTSDGPGGGITNNQQLSWVTMPVISNEECSRTFGIIVHSTLCTSGAGARSTCGGDSGGPLTTIESGQRILIGVTSFVNAGGCQRNTPAGFARVTAFLSWIRPLM